MMMKMITGEDDVVGDRWLLYFFDGLELGVVKVVTSIIECSLHAAVVQMVQKRNRNVQLIEFLH